MRHRYHFLKRLGIRGISKSLFWSLKKTGTFASFLAHKNVITNIKGSLDVEGRLIVGLAKTNASHPNIGKSKIKVEKSGEMRVRKGWANIGPCSVIHVSENGFLDIGDSYLNSNCKIICEEEIKIGDNCAIAWNVEIVDSDMHSMIYDGEKKKGASPINIGDNVWIGSNVIIKKGVTIGEGSVIAGGSIVSDDIPPKSLAAGVPAEVKKEGVSWGGIKK